MRLEKRDPRVKLLVLICVSLTALLYRDWRSLIVLTVFSVALILAGGVGIKRVWRQARGMLTLILSLFILQCVFNRNGEPFIAFDSFVLVTDQGFYTALLVTLRLIIIVVSALIVLTGETRDYLLALTQMRLPYEFAFMVMIAIRFIPLLRDEARDVLAAMQMRGTRFKKTSPAHKAKVLVSLLLPVTAGAIHRSEKLALAMEARGFRSQPGRTYMRRVVFGRADVIYTACFCAVFTALTVLCAVYFG